MRSLMFETKLFFLDGVVRAGRTSELFLTKQSCINRSAEMKLSLKVGLTPLKPGKMILLHLQPVVSRMSCSISDKFLPSLVYGI